MLLNGIPWVLCTFLFVSRGLGQTPPVIVVLPLYDGESAVSFQNGTHIVADNSSYFTVELKCTASYPVMWSLQSLEQPLADETWAERTVTDFYDETTYTYSMLLKLWKMKYRPGDTECQVSRGVEEYLCHAVDNMNMSARRTVDWVDTRRPTCEGIRHESQLAMEFTPEGNVTCCIQPGLNETFTSDHIAIYRRGCETPLMCLTKKEHMMLREQYSYPISAWINTTESSPTCRTFKRMLLLGDPVLLLCHIRTDMKFTSDEFLASKRGYHSREYEPLHHQHRSENAYLMQTEVSEAYTRMVSLTVTPIMSRTNNLVIGTRRRYNSLNETSDFYLGEVVRLLCEGSGFYYAHNTVWEFSWENGSTTLNYTQVGAFGWADHHDMEVKMLPGLAKISCHIPLWNSTEWRTLSLKPNIQAPRPPSSATGLTFVYQDVEFVGGESAELVCDLDGIPRAAYSWSLSSCYFEFHVGDQPLSPDPYCVGYKADPSTVSIEPGRKTSNLTVTLHQRHFSPDVLGGDTLQGTVSCTATNLVGNATKVFNIAAIRPVPPVLQRTDNPSRVLLLNDEHVVLNCSIIAGLPAPRIHWRKETRDILSMPDQYTVQQQEHGNTSLLVIKSVDYRTEGEYTCIASNVAGNQTRRFTVIVREREDTGYWHLLTIISLAIVSIAIVVWFAYFFLVKSKGVTVPKLRAHFANNVAEMEIGNS